MMYTPSFARTHSHTGTRTQRVLIYMRAHAQTRGRRFEAGDKEADPR